MRHHTLSFITAIFLLSCGSENKPAPQPKVEKPAEPKTKAPDEKPATVATSTSAPATIAPGAWLETPIPPFEKGMMDHVTAMGWSKDSTEFMYCYPQGGTEGEVCVFQNATNGKKDVIETFDTKGGKVSEKAKKSIEDRKTKMTYAPSTTDLPGLYLFWKETKGDEKVTTPIAKLTIGVRSPDKKKEASPISLDQRGVTVHPEAIQVSPDGRYLAVVAHSYMGEYSDEFTISLVAVDSLQGLVK